MSPPKNMVMTEGAPYFVVIDANIWVAERLLQSSIGNAFLFAVTGAKSSIALPEVVELEIARVLPDLAERAVGLIGREMSLLRQLSGHNLMVTGPTALAIKEGIEDRWKQLDGLLTRVPFTHEQAKSALNRVIRKSPPSGENNEQFRDCCIWDAAISLASNRVVHLITGDSAFYEGRSKTAGLASPLRAEQQGTKYAITIHPNLRDFLAAIESSAASIDEATIGSSIVQAIKPQAREIAAKDDKFDLGEPQKPKIRGYATPKPSLIAISFEVSFDLERTEVQGETETHSDAILSLKGVCSYDPIPKLISEIEVREWTKSLKSSGGGLWSTTSPDRSLIDRQYSPGHMRIIS